MPDKQQPKPATSGHKDDLTTAQAKNLPRSLRWRYDSSATQMTRTYIGLLVVIMIVISLSTVAIVGSHLLASKYDDAKQLMTTTQQTFKNNEPDWDYFARTAHINPRRSFVRVQITPTLGEKRVYFSRGTDRFLATSGSVQSLSRHVEYDSQHGLYYHTITTKVQHGEKVRYELWLSLDNLVDLLQVLLVVIIGVTIIGIVVGAWLISYLAKRLNRPLVQLTEASQAIISAEENTYHESLPVAVGPKEVRELSIEFNRLLQSLNRQVIRDHQFVSDASHELRTPLSAIRGHVALIQRHGDSHPELVPDSLATIDMESKKMQALVENLLRLSRMDHAELTLDWLDLSALARQVATRFANETGRDITVEAIAGVMAYANADSVEQIMMSLLNNAVKYSPADTPIKVQVALHDKRATVAIADEGPGVADADKPRIFDRFFRADSSRSQAIPGTGLGLAITSRQVALNHGDIAITDATPHGAIFTVSLPGMQTQSEKISE